MPTADPLQPDHEQSPDRSTIPSLTRPFIYTVPLASTIVNPRLRRKTYDWRAQQRKCAGTAASYRFKVLPQAMKSL
jgi:hypothetical protein